MTEQITIHEEELFTLSELGRRWHILPAFVVGVLRDERIKIFRLQYPNENKNLTICEVDMVNANDSDTHYVIRSVILSEESTLNALERIKAKLHDITVSENIKLKCEMMTLRKQVEKINEPNKKLQVQQFCPRSVLDEAQNVTVEEGDVISLPETTDISPQNETHAAADTNGQESGQVATMVGVKAVDYMLSRARAMLPNLSARDRKRVEAWIWRKEGGHTVDDLATHLNRSKRTAESYLTEAKRIIGKATHPARLR